MTGFAALFKSRSLWGGPMLGLGGGGCSCLLPTEPRGHCPECQLPSFESRSFENSAFRSSNIVRVMDQFLLRQGLTSYFVVSVLS